MPHTRTAIALALALAAPPAAAQDDASYTPPDALTDPELLALHDRLLTLDTHVDIGLGHGSETLDPGRFNRAQVNLPSMRIGGLDAGFFIVYVPQGELDPEGYAEAQSRPPRRSIAASRRCCAPTPTASRSPTTADEVERLVADGMLVALIGIENGYPLGTTPEEVAERVAMWADRGARYASITHFGHNQFGGSSNPSDDRGDGEDPGLNDLGRALVAELNDHGIMVDVSHVGPRTAAEAMEASRAPVIASHSGAAGVYENPRNLTDEQLRAIAEDDGVAQMVAYRSYVAEEDAATTAEVDALRERLGLASGADFAAATPVVLEEYATERQRIRAENVDVTLAQFADHIDHAVEVAGIDHVGLSGDFDGGGGVEGWDGAEESANVTAELLARGYTEEDLAKLWGGNALRVMRAAEAAAR